MKNYRKHILTAVLLIIFLGVGIGAGYFLGFKNEQAVLDKKLAVIRPLRENNSSYKFIDPLLAYIIPSSDQEAGLASLKNKISSFIDSNKTNNNLSNASVFFYDLNRGRWIGVNETEKYDPASMLKVVIMVSYFKETENEPATLGRRFVYTKDLDSIVRENVFNSLSDLIVGQSYTVEDLINRMITNSDNGADILLLANIDSNSLNAVYGALNIENPDSIQGNFVISPRTYSLFFRILYSATYLSKESSEKALEILSAATFKDGLVAGLPQNITAAHKFGQHVISQNNQAQEIELSDCGIIYYPKNPYFLCVMTRGSNLNNLESAIKNISSIVYQDYSSLK